MLRNVVVVLPDTVVVPFQNADCTLLYLFNKCDRVTVWNSV